MVRFFENNGFEVDFSGLEEQLKLESENKADAKKAETDAVKLARYIHDTVSNRSALPYACPSELQHEIMSFVELWRQRETSPIIEKGLERCRRFEDICLQGLDVYIRCGQLKTKCLRYLSLLPLGREEGELLEMARKVYALTHQYLEENSGWSERRTKLSELDEALSASVDRAFMQDHSALIRDSFSILSLQKGKQSFGILFDKMTDTFLRSNLRLNDTQILNWIGEYTKTVDQSHVVTLTPYAMARVCWQALTTSPKEWSENFIRLFELVVIPLIELALDPNNTTIDENNVKFIKNSYSLLLPQLKWLLSLAKNPSASLSEGDDAWPLKFPANLSGYCVGDLRSLNALAFRLSFLSGYRGRLRQWMDGVDVDKLEFINRTNDGNVFESLNPYFITALLICCPVADRLKILKKGVALLLTEPSENVLKEMLNCLYICVQTDQFTDGVSDLYAVLELFKSRIRSDRVFFSFMLEMPERERAKAILLFKELFKNANIFIEILKFVPGVDRAALVESFSFLFFKRDNFEKVSVLLSDSQLLSVMEVFIHSRTYKEVLLILERQPEARRLEGVLRLLSIPKSERMSFPLRKAMRLLSEEDALKLLTDHEDSVTEFEVLRSAFPRIIDRSKKYSLYKRKYQHLLLEVEHYLYIIEHFSSDKHGELVEDFFKNCPNLAECSSLLLCLNAEKRAPYVERHLEKLSRSEVLGVINGRLLPESEARLIFDQALYFFEDPAFFLSGLSAFSHGHVDELLEANFSRIYNGLQLYEAIFCCSSESLDYWINKGIDKISSANELGALIHHASQPLQAALIDKCWHLIKDLKGLAEVASSSRYCRPKVCDKGWHLVKDLYSFLFLLLAIGESLNSVEDVNYLLDKGAHFINEDQNFIRLMFGLAIGSNNDHLASDCTMHVTMARLKDCQNPLKTFKSLLNVFDEHESKISAMSTRGSFYLLSSSCIRMLDTILKVGLQVFESRAEWEELLNDAPKRYQRSIKAFSESLAKDFNLSLPEEEAPAMYYRNLS